MKFGDYSPPPAPSLDHQRDALRKGLGRALQWALRGSLDQNLLLEACLRDQRFDMQVEELRGDWLWKMIQAVDARERFRVPILHSLYDAADEDSASQHCQLARRYAETGDETFRKQLYQIVEKKPFPDIPWLGEEEIVALDGEAAFLFAARIRGRSLATREWDWDDENLLDLAVRRLGEEHVSDLLAESSDAALSRFRDYWRQTKQKAEQQKHLPHKARMTAIPVGEILRAAESESRCFWFRGWGIHADEAGLNVVLHRLWTEQKPGVITNLLRVLSARALPAFDPRLIELCQHTDEEVRRWAVRALEQNAHPDIRSFALTQLQRHGQFLPVCLFIKNYQPGDEETILHSLELPDNECELHWLLMDVIKILENNSEANCSKLAVVTYFTTPCENCRFYAARLLRNQHVAPGWLEEECRNDCNDECRRLVGMDNGT